LNAVGSGGSDRQANNLRTVGAIGAVKLPKSLVVRGINADEQINSFLIHNELQELVFLQTNIETMHLPTANRPGDRRAELESVGFPLSLQFTDSEETKENPEETSNG
jgi:hypothetical protein